MEKKAKFRLTLVALAVGGGLFGFIQAAPASETQLIWSTTSGLVNQSTTALLEGRHAHAIRFAKDALRTKTQASNHLIARHNLCLAYSAQGKAEDAKPYCDLALAASARTELTERDGRLVAGAEITDDATKPTLEAAVRTNVARVQGHALAENR